MEIVPQKTATYASAGGVLPDGEGQQITYLARWNWVDFPQPRPCLRPGRPEIRLPAVTLDV